MSRERYVLVMHALLPEIHPALLRHKSILETYGLVSNEKSSSNTKQYTTYDKLYPPLRQRSEHERPRSVQLKPQEYLLFIVAVLAIAALIVYNIYTNYFE
ncbi:unnamed protein product [Rotaria socialis]|uniref:Uncharacterized protein n=1 Tax=Rotaria socialis TaxID=392032 RepID=A0A820TX74_9BILA|nr:unnamed protein product [Rotaria socialis]CAF4233640.1 unnamed protein product [Rotaria socialis]CAF4267141.1 unnamed protein product [Rotaria socialis]CAF4458066.1 unnamed protein product [Rotaria socialis]CAF4473709.1 unnamed protein product [Rotaria socialis]